MSRVVIVLMRPPSWRGSTKVCRPIFENVPGLPPARSRKSCAMMLASTQRVEHIPREYDALALPLSEPLRNEPMNRFTSDAMITPIRPINRKDPILERSRFVV